MANESGHVPVLAEQVLALLVPKPGEVCLDCTVGRAGHAELIMPRLQPGGRYIGLDVDPANVAYSRERLPHTEIRHRNFNEARTVLDEMGIDRVDLLLADLGFASNQMDDPDRGFSFTTDGPLDMRLDPTLPTTAADLVNDLDERELADVIYQYGEERLSRKIARKIAEERQRQPIQTTRQLADVVRRAYGGSHHSGKPRGSGGRRIDPATRTFMALRIAVNGELESLRLLLESMPALLKPGGRAAIISFHSLEDRMVKHAFAGWKREGLAEVLTRKPVSADEDEANHNPRSRAAKLRVMRWIRT